MIERRFTKSIEVVEYVCSCGEVFEAEGMALMCEWNHARDNCDHEKHAVYDIHGDDVYAEIVLVCEECCSAPFYVLKSWSLVGLRQSGNYDEEKLKKIVELIGESHQDYTKDIDKEEDEDGC